MLYYNITIKYTADTVMHHALLLCILLVASFAQQTKAATAIPDVAVTIKPLHSLVAGIMQGVAEPVLIMRSSASPHHYTLRPSERRALARAKLIFWIGAELESFMPRLLKNLDPSTRHVALIESDELMLLPARSTQPHSKSHSRIDPHIWLSVKNAHAMVDVIADELSKLDQANAAVYHTNRERLHRRINATDTRIGRKLSGKTSAFLSYHDAYQYFEHAYGLNNAGFVSSGEEISPSAKYVRTLRNRIQTQQLHCLFYEAPVRPPLVDTLTHGLAVNVFELDATGIRFEAGENTWFEIMDSLAMSYESCL